MQSAHLYSKAILKAAAAINANLSPGFSWLPLWASKNWAEVRTEVGNQSLVRSSFNRSLVFSIQKSSGVSIIFNCTASINFLRLFSKQALLAEVWSSFWRVFAAVAVGRSAERRQLLEAFFIGPVNLWPSKGSAKIHGCSVSTLLSYGPAIFYVMGVLKLAQQE
jgi:hypothetical protein